MEQGKSNSGRRPRSATFSDLLDREPLPKLPILGVLFLPRDHYPVQGVKFPPWPRGRGTALKCPTARLPAVELVILR